MPKLISRKAFYRVRCLLKNRKHTYVAIADRVGVTVSVVSTIADGRHYYQAGEAEQTRRQGKVCGRTGYSPYYLPTLEEISEACERIQAERRRVASEDDYDGWTPPVYSELELMTV